MSDHSQLPQLGHGQRFEFKYVVQEGKVFQKVTIVGKDKNGADFEMASDFIPIQQSPAQVLSDLEAQKTITDEQASAAKSQIDAFIAQIQAAVDE